VAQGLAWEVREGDSRDLLRAMPDASVDAIVCDPPYELGFMGKRWDSTGIAYSVDLWREALRVLKPGGHLLAFGGTRTYHRMACAIEDVGFEIRDSIHWMYGSGFPKSLSVEKNGAGEAWKGWGTALKPAHEPVVMARRPLDGTVAANVLAHGTGAINVDGCRVAHASAEDLATSLAKNPGRSDLVTSGVYGAARPQQSVNVEGRWPANVLLSHAEGCGNQCADGCPVAELDRQSGNRPGMSGGGKHRPGYSGGMFGAIDCTHTARGDSGGASRFFYTAKPSTAERDAGLERLPLMAAKSSMNSHNGTRERFDGALTPCRANIHPTVKPIAIMRYLVRLVTPPGGLVLDPFAGSGTTGCAAVLEGARFLGLELEPKHAEIARARIAHWAAQVPKQGELWPDASAAS
jgi:DNA modification methylase